MNNVAMQLQTHKIIWDLMKRSVEAFRKGRKMAIDTEAIEKHIRGIIKALGDNPDREGLKDTPKRVAHMYEEVFEGMNYSNREIAQMFKKPLKKI